MYNTVLDTECMFYKYLLTDLEIYINPKIHIIPYSWRYKYLLVNSSADDMANKIRWHFPVTVVSTELHNIN